MGSYWCSVKIHWKCLLQNQAIAVTMTVQVMLFPMMLYWDIYKNILKKIILFCWEIAALVHQFQIPGRRWKSCLEGGTPGVEPPGSEVISHRRQRPLLARARAAPRGRRASRSCGAGTQNRASPRAWRGLPSWVRCCFSPRIASRQGSNCSDWVNGHTEL